ncbi:MAG: flagellar export chaperone FliS [Succinatimonas sp.]|jgi:flagellar protein FliS|nr:flagellar export chaperone FliS [Succinatimonas sp.]MDY6246960.1 flagellar export chaperone FliS [Succinivibrio sp.]CCX91951.1 flagellar protein FliS [Succinatimonas sp. CAG:777]MCI7026127.1 flagellar export chaperone FliS [Succinatimonas sp.]MDD6754778.1 flagellar export chaperone FliS [Succinatimonas sp.]
MYGRNLRAYQKTTVNAEISVADPYYVTKLLYQGLFERLAQAKGAIERGDLALKAKKLSTATAILENLRSTLDFSQSKTIAQGLYDIYSYMIDQVAEASLNLMTQPIDNAIRALMPIKKAWDSIPVTAQQEAASKRTQEQLNVDLNHADNMAKGSV